MYEILTNGTFLDDKEDKMAANALKVIKQAEADAKLIRQNAAEEAQTILAEAEKKGQALIDEARRDALKARADAIAEAGVRATEIARSAESDATVKSAVLTSKAEQNMPEAERLILERIGSIWQ